MPGAVVSELGDAAALLTGNPLTTDSSSSGSEMCFQATHPAEIGNAVTVPIPIAVAMLKLNGRSNNSNSV